MKGGKADKQVVIKPEDRDVGEVQEPSSPDEPLDLGGFETMKETFGRGSNRRVVLVSKPITLNELVRMAR
jgi:hypothetical protein